MHINTVNIKKHKKCFWKVFKNGYNNILCLVSNALIGSRALSCSDPYCQSTCLSVGLPFCHSVVLSSVCLRFQNASSPAVRVEIS